MGRLPAIPAQSLGGSEVTARVIARCWVLVLPPDTDQRSPRERTNWLNAWTPTGWSRWLELRLPEPSSRLAGRIWPIAFTLVGVILVLYRES